MRNKIKALFVGILMLATTIAISAGDVLFQDGGLNVSQNLLVNTNTLYVDSAGYVGIGTTTPGFALEVNGRGKFGDYLYVNSGGVIQSITGGLNVNSGDVNSRLDLQNNGGITSIYGNVGIGTASPNKQLHVVGSENLTGTLYYGALQAQSPHAFINDDGKSRTEICLVADDGEVVLMYLKKIGTTFEWVYEENAKECLEKEIVEGINIEYETIDGEQVEKSRTEIRRKVFQR